MFESIKEGLFITLSTLGLTILLEIFSISHVINLFRRGGKELYLKSIYYNLFNNLFLGTLSYAIFSFQFAVSIEKSFLYLTFEFLSLLLIQSLGYYFAHRLMHTNRFYYIHKFHHQYSDIIIPIAANSVTIYEYIFAYLTPFIIGIILIRPSKYSLKYAIYCVSVGNLFIHTPMFVEKPLKYFLSILPSYFVKPIDHFDHHRKVNKKFAAPILNIDRILENL